MSNPTNVLPPGDRSIAYDLANRLSRVLDQPENKRLSTRALIDLSTGIEVEHHAAEPIDGQPPCYAGCGRPAKSTSAFCKEHAPVREHPTIGSSWMCPACFVALGSCRDFDRHQRVDYDNPTQAVTCIDPATLGLIRDSRGVWMSEAGIRKNERIGRTAGRRKKDAA